MVLISLCHILMGCWVWIDNRWAVIPNITGEANWSLDLDFIADLMGLPDDPLSHKLMSPAQAAENNKALPLVEGNGDEDDDRVEPFVPPPFLAVRSRIEVVLKKPAQVDRRQVASYKDMGQLKVAPASTLCIERRTLATYKDFGHLKVGPAGEVASIINSYASASTTRPLQFILGGLGFF